MRSLRLGLVQQCSATPARFRGDLACLCGFLSVPQKFQHSHAASWLFLGSTGGTDLRIQPGVLLRAVSYGFSGGPGRGKTSRGWRNARIGSMWIRDVGGERSVDFWCTAIPERVGPVLRM